MESSAETNLVEYNDETIDYTWEISQFRSACIEANRKGKFIRLFKYLPSSKSSSVWGVLIKETKRNCFEFSLRKSNPYFQKNQDLRSVILELKGGFGKGDYNSIHEKVVVPFEKLPEPGDEFTEVIIHSCSGDCTWSEEYPHIKLQSFPNIVLEIRVIIAMSIFSSETILVPSTDHVESCSKSSGSSLSMDFRNLLTLGTNADVSFKIKDDGTQVMKTLKAHRLILSARSPVFNAMFQNEMLEQTTGEIVIVDMSQQVLEIMLGYIYSGELDSAWKTVAEGLAYAADKYQMKDLQEFLDSHLVNACSPENAMNLFISARTFKLTKAEAGIKSYIKDNIDDYLNACLK